MPTTPMTRSAAAATLALLLALLLTAGPAMAQAAPFTIQSARISLSGTSNIHAYTASTTTVKLVSAKGVATTDGDQWDALLSPGGLEAFEIAIPAASLASPKGDLDKNMHKALKVTEHPEIVFRFSRIETGADTKGAQVVGVLRIAGVEKDVMVPLTIERAGATLKVSGEVPIVMTEFGIVPPRAMIGMLRTDPKVMVNVDLTLVH